MQSKLFKIKYFQPERTGPLSHPARWCVTRAWRDDALNLRRSDGVYFLPVGGQASWPFDENGDCKESFLGIGPAKLMHEVPESEASFPDEYFEEEPSATPFHSPEKSPSN